MNFDFSSNPHLIFGPGRLNLLPELAARYGQNLLVLTGRASFMESPSWKELKQSLEKNALCFTLARVKAEPSPGLVDTITEQFRRKNIHCVAAIGGGSVLDAGKAVSAMLPCSPKDSVMEFLEGVGSRTHNGRKIPFIAVPTTSGTGSEATKNAVLSQVGPEGYKKSLRHDHFIPDIALVDPELTLDCPARITSACGMDALTQLLEAFVSTKAGPMTDALAASGLEHLGDSLVRAVLETPGDIKVRTNLSYASYVSGLVLANAGLGVVHGFASVLGGRFDIPHGVVCGTLVAQTTRKNIDVLIRRNEIPGLLKYARAGSLIQGSEDSGLPEDPAKGAGVLIRILEDWTGKLEIPRLGEFGVQTSDIESIVKSTGLKNNPVPLSDRDLAEIIRARL
ncbi:iron-containing alcohol dehydrogenase [Desulfospira joergensenii]|uniref:iron-containing alcohol dehydrogenase n=1 Tax=Desulfospira joergensenii TaxID=53329 RepID=UPI0003B51B1B|nr:iron-containing alcohol dehydrogenase [Desulfospira joergensenii]